MIRSHKSKTLYKYLLTYAITLTIPLFVFLYHINNNIISLFEQQTMDTVRVNLLNGKNRTEQKFNEMQKITISIQENMLLMPHVISENHYKMLKGVEELKKYMSGNEFYYDIAYYIRGDDKIYTSYQYSSVDTFINIIYNFKNWNYEDFYNDINTIQTPVLRAADRATGLFSEKDIIVYMHPVRNHNPYATVIFLINNSKMKELHEGIMEEYHENVYLLNSEGKLITSVNENNIADDYFIEHLSALPEDNLSEYSSISKNGYIVSRVITKDSKLQFVSVVNSDRIMKKTDSIRNRVYLVFAFVFLAGVVIIVIAIYINYTPLHRLYKKISDKVQTGFAIRDEMAAVDMAFDRMVTDIDRLNKSTERYKNNLRIYILKELVNGTGFHGERLGEIGLLSPDPQDYTAIVIKYPDPGNVSDKADFMQSFCEVFGKELNSSIGFYSIKNIEEDQLILILYSDKLMLQKEYLKNLLTNICSLVPREKNVKPVIGIGKTYKDILSIGQSFSEASKVIQYNMVSRGRSVMHFEEIETAENITEPYIYPYDELAKLTIQLRAGNIDKADETLDNLNRTLLRKDIPEFIIRCIVFDIFNMLIKASIEMNISLDADNYLRTFTTEKKQSISSLLSMLNFAYREFCARVSENKSCDNPLLDKIMPYIHSNYRNYNFSLQEMASHLGITVPYLSQFFKNNTGENITEYIWKLRLEAAKHMFANTQLPVNEVVKSVGYIDVSSFCRRFKNEVGITPGAYILKHRNKQKIPISGSVSATENIG